MEEGAGGEKSSEKRRLAGAISGFWWVSEGRQRDFAGNRRFSFGTGIAVVNSVRDQDAQ